MNEPNESLDYAAYYHRVKEFGASRNWSDIKINKMLGDRKAFEKEWKLVSNAYADSLKFENKVRSRHKETDETNQRNKEAHDRLYEQHFERMQKMQRAMENKARDEEETAIQLSQMPLTKTT